MRDSVDSPEARRFRRAKRILADLLALPAEARASRLSEACVGDPVLKTEVESLLAYADHANEAFLASTAAADRMQLEGTRVGAYRVERLLGRGGMGAVYLASRDDGEFSKRVAVKVVRTASLTPAMLDRFRVERQVLADLEHPNVARLLDGGTLGDGLPYIVMEYVDGRSVANLLEEEGPLPTERVLAIARDVAAALDAIHSRGLVFRDLKPSNVLVTRDGTAKLVDFGIAKATDAAVNDLTAPGVVVGTPHYMSPEQAAGDAVDERSDVFAFGVLVYQMIADDVPFTGDTRRRYLADLMSAAPRGLPTDTPPALAGLVTACLRKDPAKRPASGGTLLHSLEKLGPDGRIARANAGRQLTAAIVMAGVVIGLIAGAMLLRGADLEDRVSPTLGSPDAIVSWATYETDAQMSPTGRLLSFVSDRGGDQRIWVRGMEQGDFRPVAGGGGQQLSGHCWSPDGSRIAYITLWPTRSILTLLPLDDAAPVVHELPLVNAYLVGWIGAHVYLGSEGTVYRLNPDDGQIHDIGRRLEAPKILQADIHRDERQVVFQGLEDGMTSIYRGDLETGAVRRLTHERIQPYSPRWLGASSDIVFLAKGPEGQVDIWHLDIGTGQRTRLTNTPARESTLHVGPRGEELLVTVMSQRSDVRILEPGTARRGARITEDSLTDSRPSASADGGFIAFERARRLDTGDDARRSRVFGLRPDTGALPRELDLGLDPRVSPSGLHVAYRKRVDPTDELWLFDLARGTARLASPRLATAAYNPFPRSWVSNVIEWSPDGSQLYFLQRLENGDTGVRSIDAASTGNGAPGRTVVTVRRPESVHDLRISPDGRSLGYLLESPLRAAWELVAVDLTTGTRSTPYRGAFDRHHRFLGWDLSGNAILGRMQIRLGFAEPLEVIRVDAEGIASVTAELGGVARGSLVLDADRNLVYYSIVREATHELRRLSLDLGSTERIDIAETPGIAFAGVQPLRDGRVLYSRQEFGSDVWLIGIDRNGDPEEKPWP